ncbi:MAG: hypothetical protein J5662_08365 [Clostridia bacterium]|nr:hypothetical protein [Clostridia bacterium]
MEEIREEALPEVSGETSPAEDVHPTVAAENTPVITVKFNKEIKNLTADEAATLAQKGMKFEIIEEDFLKLKALAGKKKMSVPEYISELEKNQIEQRRREIMDEYKETESLADRIAELESGEKDEDGLDELREYFPTVKSLSDLPRAVVESARLKGENLLNSYLKYRLVTKRQADAERLFERGAKEASVGSLKSAGDTADDAFLRALWGK